MSINSPIFYAILMIFAGMGIPVMAALNAGLGGKLQNPGLATIVLVVVALFAATALMLVTAGTSFTTPTKSTPVYFYMAGLLFIFYISSISWVAPKFGFGNAITFILLGQLISMCVIDHFSLFNAVQYAFSWKRLLGILLMISGIYLIVKRS